MLLSRSEVEIAFGPLTVLSGRHWGVDHGGLKACEPLVDDTNMLGCMKFSRNSRTLALESGTSICSQEPR